MYFTTTPAKRGLLVNYRNQYSMIAAQTSRDNSGSRIGNITTDLNWALSAFGQTGLCGPSWPFVPFEGRQDETFQQWPPSDGCVFLLLCDHRRREEESAVCCGCRRHDGTTGTPPGFCFLGFANQRSILLGLS